MNFRPVCLFSSHLGYLLDRPCLIFFSALLVVLSVLGASKSMVPSVVGSRIYGVLRVSPSGALNAIGVWLTGREL